MKNTLLWLLLLGCPALVGASPDTPRPEMFAYGSNLDLPGNNPFYYCDLPLEIYRSTSRPDLGDLRVFNGGDQVVPHALQRPARPATYNSSQTRAEVNFFPLAANADQKLTDLIMHVEKNAAGTIIDVRTDGSLPSDQEKKIIGYLLDTSPFTDRSQQPGRAAVPLPPSSLDLEWSDAQNDFLGRIVVETSSDLITWHPVTSATLARMQHQGFRLDRREISLPGRVQRYLRLTWPVEQPPILLTRVTGRASTTRMVADQLNLAWLPAEAKADPKHPGLYLVDLGGWLPVERLRLGLPDRNTMAVATISSATAPDGPFTREWQGLLYHLVAGDEEIRNPEIALRPGPRRYWRIAFAASESGPPSPPTLDCGWQADQLLFLAQGSPPFRVLYGSGAMQPADFKMNNLLTSYQGAAGSTLPPVPAQLGPRYVQGGEQMLSPRPPPRQWRKYILWLVLSSGVLLIGWMSVSLYRQLQSAEK